MKISRITSVLVVGIASLVFGKVSPAGTVGGGGPPAIQLEQQELLALKSGALNGDFIRVTEPGLESVYLRPQVESMRDYSMAANSLSDGSEMLFVTQSTSSVLKTATALSIARTVKSLSPGILPILSEDIELKPKTKVEAVSASEALNQR